MDSVQSDFLTDFLSCGYTVDIQWIYSGLDSINILNYVCINNTTLIGLSVIIIEVSIKKFCNFHLILALCSIFIQLSMFLLYIIIITAVHLDVFNF